MAVRPADGIRVPSDRETNFALTARIVGALTTRAPRVAARSGLGKQHLARDHILATQLRFVAADVFTGALDARRVISTLLDIADTVEAGLQQFDWAAIVDEMNRLERG